MSGPIQGNQPTNGLVPITRVRRQIEADVTVKATDDRIKVEGDVFIGKRFLPTVIQRSLGKSEGMRKVTMAYQPGSDQYKLTGEVKVAGLWLKAAGSTKATMDGNDIVLRNVKFDFPGSSIDWLQQKARDGVVKALNGEGITAARQGNDIRISATRLLQHVGVLPAWGKLADDTTGSVSHDAEGNLAVHFGGGKAGIPDGTSCLQAHLDPAAGRRVLADMLGSEYRMTKAEFQTGKIQVHGSAAVPELRNAISAGKLLIGLLARDARVINASTQTATPYIPLNLEMRAEGTQVVIKPDKRMAVGAIAKDLGKGGAPVTKTKDDARVDANSFLPESKVKNVSVAPDGLRLEADMNLDSLLAPALR
jgi:hypothetical protein